MVRMEKAPIMGSAHAVSDMMMRRSAGNLPKTRTTCAQQAGELDGAGGRAWRAAKNLESDPP